MSKEQLGARVDADGSLYKDFEGFEESGGFESRSEAIRAVMRSGLDEKSSDPLDDRPDSLLAGLLWDARRDIHTFFAVMLLATILSVVSSGMLEVVAGAVALLYLLTVTVGFVDAVLLDNSIKLWSMDHSTAVNEVEA